MKVLDLIRLIAGNLNRRKARVGLTAIGVVIGTAAVVILVSLAIGLQKNANEQLYGGDQEQLQSASQAAFDEVRRLDRMLSNYRPQSEWSEVNRSAAERPPAGG